MLKNSNEFVKFYKAERKHSKLLSKSIENEQYEYRIL